MNVSPQSASGKVVLITGAGSGIGKAAAIRFASLDASVVIAVRDRTRGEAALQEIQEQAGGAGKVEMMIVDLSSQASIRRFTAEFLERQSRLDVLINNAANFDLTLQKPVLTADSVETIFATNYLGPFLLTRLLLERLRRSAPSRILNVSSLGIDMLPSLRLDLENLNGEKSYSAGFAYYRSKLALVIFTKELARRMEGSGVTVNGIRVPNVALEPARYRHLPWHLRIPYSIKRRFAMSPARMAEVYAAVALAPDFSAVTGVYFDEECRQAPFPRHSADPDTNERLWRVSEKLTGLADAP